MNTFLTEIMLFTGFGAFLDTIFITSNERKIISSYLETGTKNLTLTERFSNFLARAHSIVFGRFFSAKLFSIGFMGSAAIVSLVSFGVVITLQAHFFPEIFLELQFDKTQVSIFLAFIAFNIVFDYVTIIQTKVFIEASLSAKSIFRALLFIASDLVVTLNAFIIFYAYFLLFIVQIFVSNPQNATIILASGDTAANFNANENQRFLPNFRDQPFIEKFKYRGSVSGALFADEDRQNAEHIFVSYFSTFDVPQAETQALLLSSLTNLNLDNIRLEKVLEAGDKEKFYSALAKVDSFRNELADNQAIPDIISFQFEVDGSVRRSGSLDLAYTRSFFLTDQLEDGFPASVIEPLELPTLSMLIEELVTAPAVIHPSVVCFENSRPTKRFLLSNQSLTQFETCDQYVLVELFWSNAMDKSLALNGRDTGGYRVPYNTLLITSILPTAFFYLAIVLLAFATLCFSKIVNRTNRIQKFVLRAPLAVSGFVLGTIISLAGVL